VKLDSLYEARWANTYVGRVLCFTRGILTPYDHSGLGVAESLNVNWEIAPSLCLSDLVLHEKPFLRLLVE
jgi:hypothetical protein